MGSSSNSRGAETEVRSTTLPIYGEHTAMQPWQMREADTRTTAVENVRILKKAVGQESNSTKSTCW